MTDRAFLVTAAIGVALAAVLLALAAALRSGLLAVGGVICVAVVMTARETWIWRGHGRAWLVAAGILAGVIALAFAWQQLFG